MLKKDAQAFLDKVADDEPIFILRAQDICMTEAIDHWITCVQDEATDKVAATEGKIWDKIKAKLGEADECVKAVKKWQNHNHTKIPD